jgi:hypothetical protein
MRRFSIRSLMAFVLVSAVVLTALRNADDAWAGGMILGTPLLLGVALIAALCGRERSRAGRLGFAILGGGYLALAFLGLSERDLAKLPTTRLLIYVHQQVSPPLFVFQGASGPPVPLVVVTTSHWSHLLPGAANLEAFSVVGHCLFALLVGLLGATVAVWFSARRERAEIAAERPNASSSGHESR